jgi:hypothetical protein
MRSVAVAILALLLLAGGRLAADPVDYLRDIKPILAAKCYPCHGGLQQKSDLRVDTVKFLRQGGSEGPAVIPGHSEKSPLVRHITASHGARRMPPASEGEPLSTKQIALIRAWIDQGAKGPADERPEADPRDHWAFRPPVRPAVPLLSFSRKPLASAETALARGLRLNEDGGNPIDAFLAAEWAKHGLTPVPQADKRLLLRRVYLDLIGLPPSRAEIEAFVQDQSPGAYEKVVDRLLASPQYGERWARHWMDVWRYSDWWGLGQEVRNSQKHIWHWRDWIIESLNKDKGYDQMVREMLAADELYPTDLNKLRATGYLVRPYFLFNRTTWLDEVIEHTTKGFLGLTFNCAKCHDHKYDPIRQADYYRFRAFFEPYQLRTEQVPGEADFTKDGIPRAYDCNLDVPTYLFRRGDDRQPVKTRKLAPGLPKFCLAKLDIHPVPLPLEACAPQLRPFVLENYLRAAQKQIQAARVELELANKRLADSPKESEQIRAALHLAEKKLAAAQLQPALLRARYAADWARYQQPPAGDVHERAKEAAKLERQAAVTKAEEAVAAAELKLLQAPPAQKPMAEKALAAARQALDQARRSLAKSGENYTSLQGALKAPESNLESEASRRRPFPTTSTGRRTALALWITDRRNPLTARVAVNHIWMRHFGKPLVPTVFDFGRKGTPPTHPELLDWLAVEFMEHNWSMKHLHRLIVISRAYRLSCSTAGAPAHNREVDPANRFYWRRDPIRMEAQVVRDSLLSLAGLLDRRMGGPSVPIAEESTHRRALYFVHSHNDNQKFLALFDDAPVRECYRRSESIVPQQALALSNSKVALESAAQIADRLDQQLGPVSDREYVRAAFELLLAAEPTPEELSACKSALHQWQALLKGRSDAQRRARRNLVHALVNHNDFITVR